MKKLLPLFLCLLMLGSCSIYSVNKVKLKTAQKESYTVTYQADLAEGLTARISYVDANGETVKLKGITGNWEKTVSRRSGTAVSLKVVAKGKDLSENPKIKGKYAPAAFKIKVDGETVSEYILKNKKVKYKVVFVLP